MRHLRTLLTASLITLSIGTLAASAAKVYDPGNGVSLPVVVKQVRATYPATAKDAHITGVVLLESVVAPDGTVRSIKVLKSVDKTLDRAAVAAMKQWQFKPGVKDGKPVAVRIRTEITFSLK